MNREDVIRQLLRFPALIQTAEQAVCERQAQVLIAREHLRAAEDRFLLDGQIEGRNEAIRAAALRDRTNGLRVSLLKLERDLDAAQVTLRVTRDEFAAWHAVARLIGGEMEMG